MAWKKCRIFEKGGSYELSDIPAENIQNACQEIWDHPEIYSLYSNRDDASFSFLRNLWVEWPSGHETLLANLVIRDQDREE